jgi:hypothetical protein
MILGKIKKAFFTFFKLLGAILVLSIIYVCFVPPFGEIPRADRLRIRKLDPKENALTAYNLAIKDLENVPLQTSLNIGGKLERAARGLEDVDENLMSFLEEHKEAIEQLKESAKAPQYQFYDHSPTFSDPMVDFITSRQLFNLSGVQARIFIDKGDLLKAAELNLAAYKMASNLSMEPNGNLIFNLVSESTRAIVAGNLFYLFAQKELPEETLIQIASQLEKIDRDLPDPQQVMMREWKTLQLSLDSALIEQNASFEVGNKKLDYLPSALKARIYQSSMQKIKNYIMVSSVPLKQWDFKGADAAQGLLRDIFSLLSEKTIVDTIGLFDTFVYSPSGTMGSLYVGRANSAALRSFAVCALYKKAKGKFPETLDQAFDEVGAKLDLTIPLDPVTNQPINYRIEDGKPIVWFVGKDCKDDGGVRTQNSQEIHKGVQGTDIVFSYRELPPWFNPNAVKK